MRKGFGMASGILIVAIVFISAMVVGVPSMVVGVYNQIAGVQTDCREDHWNTDCICDAGERKVAIGYAFTCENVDRITIDPESPTFEEDSIEFVDSWFTTSCGDIFQGLECGGVCSEARPDLCTADRYMIASWGYSNNRRIVVIECVDNVNSNSPWRVLFYVESATDTPMATGAASARNYYYNPTQDQVCATQEYCDYHGNPTNCNGLLPIEIIPGETLFSIFGI